MKLLLDENLPKRLKNDFPDHKTCAFLTKLSPTVHAYLNKEPLPVGPVVVVDRK